MKNYPTGGRGGGGGINPLTALLSALAGTPGTTKDAKGNTVPAKPSSLQSLLHPELAGGYQQGMFGLAGQQIQGQQAIDLAKAKAALDSNQAFRDQAISIAKSMNVPIADENALTQFAATTFHPSLINAAAQQGVAATQLGTAQATATGERKMAESPTGQEASGQNYLAGQNAQFVKNEATIPETGPFNFRFGSLGTGQGDLSVTGFQPGSASTKQNTFTMKNGLPVQTETSTTTPTTTGGTGAILKPITDSADDYNTFLQNKGSTAPQMYGPQFNQGMNPSPISLKPQTDNSLGPIIPYGSMLTPPNTQVPQQPPQIDNSAAAQLIKLLQGANQQSNTTGQGVVNPMGNVPNWMRVLQGAQ